MTGGPGPNYLTSLPDSYYSTDGRSTQGGEAQVPATKRRRVPRSASTSQTYSLWTVPHACWSRVLEGVAVAVQFKVADANRELKKSERKFADRLKAFETPVTAEALNTSVQ